MRLRDSPRSFFAHFPGPRGYGVATTPTTSHQSPRRTPAPSVAFGYVVATAAEAAERQPAGACFFVTDDGLQLYTKGTMLHHGGVWFRLDNGALWRYDWPMITHSPSPISASAAGTDRRALAREAHLAEVISRSGELMPSIELVKYDDSPAAVAAQKLEVEKEWGPGWGPAPSPADLDPQDEADFLRRAEAELARSEKSLALRRILRRADAAALPQVTAHQIARRRIRTTTLARIARARISALMHARLRVAHACISARAMRAGRAAAAHKRGRRLLLAV